MAAGLPVELGRVARAAVLGLVLAVPLTLVALGLNYISTFADRDAVRAHARAAFTAGDLTEQVIEAPAWRGRDQYNDCLILFLILDREGERMERALSPNQHYDNGVGNPCVALKDRLAGEDVPDSRYHRYMHGLTALAAPLTAAVPLNPLRRLLSFVMLVAVGGLVAVSAFRLVRAVGREESGTAARSAFVLTAGLCLLLFFSLSHFANSLAHFPPALVLAAYLWIWLWVDVSALPLVQRSLLHAIFGVATAWFEFLSGGAPLGACLILYLSASTAKDRPDVVRAIGDLFAYAAAFVSAFATKMAVTVAVFGPSVVTDFMSQLTLRVAGDTRGEPTSVLGAARRLYWEAEAVGGEWEALGRALIVISILALIYGAVVLFVKRRRLANPIQPLLLLGAAGCIGVWHLLFYPHSQVHAWFMARTLVGLYFPAILLIACLHREGLSRLLALAAGMVRPTKPSID